MPVASSTGQYGAIPSAAPAVAPAPKPWTTDAFAATVLYELGAPITANNIANVTRWIANESLGNTFANGSTGNWLRDNNPLNINSTFDNATPVSHPGWGPGGSAVTVYTYSDPLTGAKATADFIKQNTPGVGAALKNDAPASILGQAVQAAGWAAGGYGGANPISGGAWLADVNGQVSNALANPLKRASNASTVSFWDPSGNGSGVGPFGSPGLNDVTGSVGAAASGLGAIGNFFGKAQDPVFWRRIGIFSGGAVIFTVGLVVFFASSDTGKKTIAAAAKVA